MADSNMLVARDGMDPDLAHAEGEGVPQVPDVVPEEKCPYCHRRLSEIVGDCAQCIDRFLRERDEPQSHDPVAEGLDRG